MGQQDKILGQQNQGEILITQPGEQIVADLLQRIKNRKLRQSKDLSWDKHDKTYTEWIRQR